MMRISATIAFGCLALLCGCAPAPYWQAPCTGTMVVRTAHPNPLFVACADHQRIWETVVDVIDDEFRIQHEEPVRAYGDTITEGRLETYYELGSTILEPWRHDSASPYEKLESTLQTIRRRVLARVTPAQGGYWIEILAQKELEDLPRPINSTAGAATFRYDSSLTRVVNPEAPVKDASQWVPRGRDTDLEQRFLDHVVGRFSGVGNPVPVDGYNPRRSAATGGPSGGPFEYRVCRAQSPQWLSESSGTGGSIATTDAEWATISGRSFHTDWEVTDPPPHEDGPLGGLQDSELGCDSIFGHHGRCGCHRFQGCECLHRWWHSPQNQEFLSNQYYDWRHMYSPSSLTMAILGLGGAAVLANTEWDQKIQDWYRDRVRNVTSDDLADFFRPFGNGWYAVPVVLAASWLGPYFHDGCGTTVGRWGDRCVRSYLVGAPLVLALQFGLGATGPNEDSTGSHWRLFNGDAAVSGQAFLGSVPFIQASMMAEGFWVKAAIFGLSSLSAWTRVNDDSHYLSQSLLGWWFAVLACEAVDLTDHHQRTFVVAPLAMNNTLGLGLVYSR